MDKYDLLTKHMTMAVEDRPTRPSLFGAFFARQDVHGENIVEFDKKQFVNGIAPFVHPTIDGKPIKVDGYSNYIFKLPTMKPSGVITNDDVNKKPFGENEYNAKVKNARVRDIVNSKVDDNEMRIDTRLEAMRADVLFNAKLTVQGDGYDDTLTFPRDAGNTVDLGSGNYWDESGQDAKADIVSFLGLLAGNGKTGTHIIGRNSVVAVLVDLVKEETDFRRVEDGFLRFQSFLTVSGAIYYGTYRGVEIWGYDGIYKDSAGATAYMVPDKKVVMLSAMNENEMSYGYAGDVEIELDLAAAFTRSPRNVFTKLIPSRSTVEIESVLTAAPLLKDGNSTLVATVIS